MTRTIALKSTNFDSLSGRHLEVARKISGTMPVNELRKRCRSLKPKRFRAIVRELKAARIVSVKRG